MIYRIHSLDNQFMQFNVSGEAAREALGEDTMFHFDHRPVPYQSDWKSCEITFYAEGNANAIPDLSMIRGKLYVSKRAYDTLELALSPHGEFLPVSHETGEGYIYNCLEVAEKYDAVNDDQSLHKPLDGHYAITFFEEKLKNINMFKAEIDFNGLFCSEIVKNLVEDKGLTGIQFVEDVGHPFPPEANMKQEH